MGGSISPETVMAIMRHSMPTRMMRTLGIGLDEVRDRMVCSKAGIGFPAFLEKFTILDDLKWDDRAIDASIEQICQDLAAEGIAYTEISLSINKYVAANNWTPDDTVRFISDSFNRYSAKYGVKVGLLLSLRYDSNRDAQITYGNLIELPIVQQTWCGIDLIGNEEHFDAEFYKPIFEKWGINGKTRRAHVGEMPDSGENVRAAIVELGVNSIAHGIQADLDTLLMAVDRNVRFDLALHSNITTGAWYDISTHPIRKMLDVGCKVTLNTDDPIQFQCSLDDEFNLALSNNLISRSEAYELMGNAWGSSHISNSK